jgi:hypothetical protein
MHPWVGLSDHVRLGAVARWVTPELVAEALDADRISFLKVLKHVRRSVIARTVTTATKMTDFMDTLASRVGRKLDSGPRRPRIADRLLKRQNSKYSYRDKGQLLRRTRSAPARTITLHSALLQYSSNGIG